MKVELSYKGGQIAIKLIPSTYDEGTILGIFVDHPGRLACIPVYSGQSDNAKELTILKTTMPEANK